jgi:hypothetical protein
MNSATMDLFAMQFLLQLYVYTKSVNRGFVHPWRCCTYIRLKELDANTAKAAALISKQFSNLEWFGLSEHRDKLSLSRSGGGWSGEH